MRCFVEGKKKKKKVEYGKRSACCVFYFLESKLWWLRNSGDMGLGWITRAREQHQKNPSAAMWPHAGGFAWCKLVCATCRETQLQARLAWEMGQHVSIEVKWLSLPDSSAKVLWPVSSYLPCCTSLYYALDTLCMVVGHCGPPSFVQLTRDSMCVCVVKQLARS